MLILLPPSEGKASGGRGAPLELSALSSPSLTGVRQRLVHALETAARTDPEGVRRALGCSPAAVAEDAALTQSPTLPALRRYTGVVYEALSYDTLSPAARRRANASLRVSSALLGLVTPTDRIPAYRLSAGTAVPGVGPLAALWRPALEPELAAHRGLVVDLRSGPYAALARVPDAVQVRVLRDTAGVRTVVSHDNKWTKGLLARELCERGARTVRDVADAGAVVADLVEVDGRRVDLVLHGLARSRPEQVGVRPAQPAHPESASAVSAGSARSAATAAPAAGAATTAATATGPAAAASP